MLLLIQLNPSDVRPARKPLAAQDAHTTDFPRLTNELLQQADYVEYTDEDKRLLVLKNRYGTSPTVVEPTSAQPDNAAPTH